MHWLYMTLRYFPVIGMVFMAAFIQIAIFYRRKGSRMRWFWAGLAVLSLASVGVWFYFKGYERSDSWVRSFTDLAPSP